MTSKSLIETNPISITLTALKAVKSADDYHQLGNTTALAVMEEAWNMLPIEEQHRIAQLLASNTQLEPHAIANQLMACSTLVEFKHLKSKYGDTAVKAAWKLLPQQECERIQLICDRKSKPQPEPPSKSVAQTPESSQQKSKRTLFDISADLEKLNDLLDNCGDDAQQQELIDSWLEQLGKERDRKLDSYCALIAEMQARAEVRQVEAKRMMELATTDENRAKLLKQRLQWFFETHHIKTVETARYKLSLQRNGGKAPLILNENVPATHLLERFQRVSIDADTTTIRQALEAGEELPFAQLGDRGQSLRIR